MDPIIEIGEQAPLFQLKDLNDRMLRLNDLLGWIVVVNFWSAECEWCMRVDHELMTYQDGWREQVKVLWIASNSNESGELIDKVAIERNLSTVLMDEQQKVADLYGAQTTPHFFVVDQEGRLRYQGAWDDITFRHRVATRIYLPEVIEALRQNRTPEVSLTPPYGCTLVRFQAPNLYSE
jgi:peroxiredoxin